MAVKDEVVFCDGCGTEIIGTPTVREGRTYCCVDCAEGRECDCGAEEDDRRAGGAVGG